MARQPTHDLVVVVPGIMGSALADRDGHAVWGLSGAALRQGIRTFGRSVTGLTLPHDLGDAHPGDGVVPTGLLPDLYALPGRWALVDGYSGLLDWLEASFTLRRRGPGEPASAAANLVAFAYDWRLSCRFNAARLGAVVDEELGRWRASAPARRDARAVLLCHSMGGLVARYWAECLGGHEVVRRIVTLGTPHRGSLDALETLVNGHGVGPRPVRAAITRLARSLPSVHQLTPDYACLDSPGGLLYPRELPSALPGPDPALLLDAGAFHAGIRDAARARTGGTDPALVPIAGVLQPTATTASVDGGGERLTVSTTAGLRAEGGDGTVPRLSAHPPGAAHGHTPCEQHGSLQNNPGVRDSLWGLLAPGPAEYRDPGRRPVRLGVEAPFHLAAGELLELSVTAEGTPGGDRLAVTAVLHPAEGGPPAGRTLRNLGEGRYRAVFPEPPAPGPYRLVVGPADRPDAAVTALVMVGDAAEDGDG
ncbi:lipase/acyltransferase domain-containing protein [Streptomyces zhihengii]|uniref:Lecithin:cholesterol acyltransferase n=1 Tax=Streptomyces zhihengii TaxID=1818004 RepID=A0ABS2UWW0_9ACTN|nr:hypothetical protein [Streptomyces zhihengii]MBM9621992.1 hypothetical protein [Streptomyces zhihengii]